MTRSMHERITSEDLRAPVVAGPGDTLRSAAYALWREDVGALVVEDAGHAVGIVTERDVVARAAHGEDLDAVSVADAMSTHLVAVRLGDTVHDAAYLMLEHGVRHLPVLDGEGRLVGVLSIRDVLRPATDATGPASP